MNRIRIIFLTAIVPLTAIMAENTAYSAEPFSHFSLFEEDAIDADTVFDETLSLFKEDLDELSQEKAEEIITSSFENPSALKDEEATSPKTEPPVLSQEIKENSSIQPEVQKAEPAPSLVTEKKDLVELTAPLAVEEKAKEAPLEAAKAAEPILFLEEPKKELFSVPEQPAVETKAFIEPSQELLSLEKEEEKPELPAKLSLSEDNLITASTPLLNLETAIEIPSTLEINLRQVFAGSPLIYTLLLVMSMGSVFIWLYNMINLKYAGGMPESVVKPLRIKLNSNQYDEALSLCAQNESLFCKMVTTGIHTRRYDIQVMLEAMRAEGKRATTGFWQRIGLLNDIAIIAPMIGLLGTVLGMFYAFYDLNRTTESVTTLFDGLGISVGTTVAGLVVAILAMLLQSTAKYRIVRQLARVENEAYSLASLIENKVPGGN
jgi:biopolymer transport protein ExbB